MTHGVIGNTSGFGPDILGSSPSGSSMEIPDYMHGIVQETLGMENDGAHKRRLWAVILGLQPSVQDGLYYFAWGDVKGSGDTPEHAMHAFEEAMYKVVGDKK